MTRNGEIMKNWNKLPRAKQKRIRKKVSEKINALIGYIEDYVGDDNYAGGSAISQLNIVWDKFSDCCQLEDRSDGKDDA